MNWIKKIAQVAILTVAISSTGYAQDIDRTQPYEMTKVVSQKLFDRLKLENESIRENPERLKVVVEEELMPYVDYRYSALKVLGKYLKQEKNKDNVREFVEAFRHYLVTSYAQVLTLYSDQSVRFEPKTKLDVTKRNYSVKLDVVDAPRPDIKVEFKLRVNKKTGEWLAFDMVAEGVSLLSSKQSEWGPKIRKEGIPSVTEELAELSSRPIRFEGEAN
ncbi:ABC transporter substrate-binding protein [Vibrio algarum]|uniref:ABC transporter substrate-binding protein n=1 Tax=Vibrio algarum TaxID=3020714 RepID=A0ABT4YMX1_9VIBR|nr:ABC transporter substrate-binding protein [Vibrio sp. KJ40-1]MDB1122899.1 ABC transporter substrate-binding protein [Vibrio sp. KJ40-1]